MTAQSAECKCGHPQGKHAKLRARPDGAHCRARTTRLSGRCGCGMYRPAVTVTVCFAQCEACQSDQHYATPTPHPWAGPDDIEHAQATGRPQPTGNCGCHCARTEPSA
ncbi:hypothetical protein [Streptomyces sp. NBC_00842]|uniref:hypothetical protein n=1 Tax=Streptomyces sp. NBC_00842 TaxID=2975848 RepID=UPI003869695F|nr:hypothetical protein OH821_45435 [Streptomyces sp. NBC_00842]